MEECIVTEMLSHDLVVSFPAKKSYELAKLVPNLNVQVRIGSIVKGKPTRGFCVSADIEKVTAESYNCLKNDFDNKLC